MIDSRWFWEGKRVTVMGLGLLGRGVGDVAYIASQGAEEVVVTDMKTAAQLEESLRVLAPTVEKYKNIRFVLGGHHEENFVGCDMVIQAAGVPKNSLYTGIAREHGIPVYMSTALAAKWCMEQGVRVVGVTGTRGKSTVSHLIYSVLRSSTLRKLPSEKSTTLSTSIFQSLRSGKLGRSGRALGEPSTRLFLQELSEGASEHSGKIHLGGNIRGVSTLQLLQEISPGDTLVLELDSWQLQGFGELTVSPNIAVFTNIMPDHLNYYKTMDEYFDDKAQIFIWQKEDDVLVCGQDIAEQIRAYQPPVEPIVPAMQHRSLRLLGDHNQLNAALAAAALRACGLSEHEIELGLANVEPVEGRLQFIKEIDGTEGKVRIYNDNNATTPEATLRALESFGTQAVTLILGGSDKGLPFDALIKKIQEKKTRVVLLPGTGSDKIASLLPSVFCVSTMAEAVQKAVEITPSGIMLLSPSCASFGLFKNEYDRNDQFLLEIAKF